MESMQKTMLGILDIYEKMSLDELNEHIAETLKSPLCQLLSAVNAEISEAVEETGNELYLESWKDVPLTHLAAYLDKNAFFGANCTHLPSISLRALASQEICEDISKANLDRGEILERISLNLTDSNFVYSTKYFLMSNICNLPNNIDEDYAWAA